MDNRQAQQDNEAADPGTRPLLRPQQMHLGQPAADGDLGPPGASGESRILPRGMPSKKNSI